MYLAMDRKLCRTEQAIWIWIDKSNVGLLYGFICERTSKHFDQLCNSRFHCYADDGSKLLHVLNLKSEKCACDMNSMKLYLMRASSSSHIKQQGYGASKSPDEALVSIRKCLFDELGPGENGWYYGSDGLRSPYHFMRSPGEEVYDGVNPFL